MAISHGLRRLLRVRELKEEQARVVLESAIQELGALGSALTRAESRARQGRALVARSAYSGELPDRLAGLAEIEAGGRMTRAVRLRVQVAQSNVTALREAFLATRVERRQVETLIEEAKARQAVEASRHNQQDLDDWHRSRSISLNSSNGSSGNVET